MISHGYPVKEQDDPIVEVVAAAVDGFSDTSEPGAYIVDMIPFRTSLSLPSAPLSMLTIYSFLYEQCNMCLIGSLERGGRRKLSGTRGYWKTWRIPPINS